MSDVGLLPPGALVWFAAFGFVIVFSLAFAVCVLIAWIGARRRDLMISRCRAFGYAIGSAASALASGFSMWLVDWSGSLGHFARWIDRPATGMLWLAGLVLLCPALGFLWNRAFPSAV